MDSDPLKRHFVRELYSAGFDELAREVIKMSVLPCIIVSPCLYKVTSALTGYKLLLYFLSPTEHVFCPQSAVFELAAAENCGTAVSTCNPERL